MDVSVTMAMLMLRSHGFMTTAALHYPGASKLVRITTASLEDDPLSDEEIASGMTDSFEELCSIVADRAQVERVLFQPPE